MDRLLLCPELSKAIFLIHLTTLLIGHWFCASYQCKYQRTRVRIQPGMAHWKCQIRLPSTRYKSRSMLASEDATKPETKILHEKQSFTPILRINENMEKPFFFGCKNRSAPLPTRGSDPCALFWPTRKIFPKKLIQTRAVVVVVVVIWSVI